MEAIKIFNHEKQASVIEKVAQDLEMMMVSWAVLLQSYILSERVSFVLIATEPSTIVEGEGGLAKNAGDASLCEYQISARIGPRNAQLRKKKPLGQEPTENVHCNTAVHISASNSSEFQDEDLFRIPFLQKEGFKYQVC